MSKRSDQIYDELLIEYADENLQVQIKNDLLADLQINKAVLTRFAKKWVEERKVKWIGTNTLQLILEDQEDSTNKLKNEEMNEKDTTKKVKPSEVQTSKELTKKDKDSHPENATLPIYFTNTIVQIIESKLETKLTKEMRFVITQKITNIDVWERTVKNIFMKEVPDKFIQDYLELMINN